MSDLANFLVAQCNTLASHGLCVDVGLSVNTGVSSTSYIFLAESVKLNV